jgi:predicted CXXCH cytochrome family protein
MNRRMLGVLLVAGFLASLWPQTPPVQAAGIADSKHNLSSSGLGTIKAAAGAESQICIFCHVPHNAKTSGPLWNRDQPASPYTPYTSTTRKITSPGQPTGASLLCLSCHDGTIALGKISSRTTDIPMAGGKTNFAAGDPGYIGTDLSDDHPVSFLFSGVLSNTEIRTPTGSVKLDFSGQMQCTACHSPHDNANGKFLVVNNVASALCTTCHNKTYWSASDHATSNKTVTGAWLHTSSTTVGGNACESCHRPHTAPRHSRLLNQSVEETNCLVCHSGTPATKNIQAELNKSSHHNVATTGGFGVGHDAAEPNVVATVHVQCVDCHNPHSAKTTAYPTKGGAGIPALAGALSNVRGVDINNAAKYPVTAEYEICFRCHADSASKPVSSSTTRLIVQNNLRLEFQPGNPSYHPIAAVGRSASVPSLIAPWTTSSILTCTDCHNNDGGPYSTAGTTGTTPTGSGVNGPHGSINPTLLERQYLKADGGTQGSGTRESTAAYALCYKCHDRTKLLANTAGSFPYHNYHITNAVNAPCNTCHDPHGISSTQGSVLSNSRLINFNSAVVSPSPGNGAARWERVGTTGGRCYLTCHGLNHSPRTY